MSGWIGRLLTTGPFLSAAAVALYLAVFFFGRSLLPEQVFRDASKIEEIVEYGSTGRSLSFDTTAWLYAALPESMREVFVALVGSVVVGMLLFRTSMLGVAIAAFCAAPTAVLGLFAMTKEVFVFCMSIIVLMIFSFGRERIWTIVAVTAIYVVYAVTVRSYYGVIILAFLLLAVIPWRHPVTWIMLPLAAFVAFLVIPHQVYELLQGQRDYIARYVAHYSPYSVRTGFFNFVPPDDPLSFMLNYGYAAAILLVPLLIDVTIKEVLLLLFNACCIVLVVIGLSSGRAEARLGALLFVSHFLTLTLFEADLGTYFRHISSVLLYLAPSLHALDLLLAARGATGPSAGLPITPQRMSGSRA